MLLNPNDAMFAFEHAMAHRELLAVMAPLNRFSVAPYFVDPAMPAWPANKWQLNHQQAHNDALRDIPSRYFWRFFTTITNVPNPTPPPPTIPVTTITPETVTFGLRIGQNLIDNDLNSPRQLTWWTFQNFMEHYVASTTVAPAPSPKPAPQSTFPFW